MPKRKATCRAWKAPLSCQNRYWRALLIDGDLWIRSHMSTSDRVWHCSRPRPDRGWQMIAMGHQIQEYETRYIELSAKEAKRLDAERRKGK